MLPWPDPATLRDIHAQMTAAAQSWSLPFRGRNWRGASGNWASAGIGSSIDFQDHRQYLPGDDPRYIDWQAYARTGHYSMKLYREEVSPRVEILFDCSASMFVTESKRRRAVELLFLCVESALRSTSAVRCHAAHPGGTIPWSLDSLLGHQPPPAPAAAAPPGAALTLHDVPVRQGSLRVLISDLLFPGSPERLLAPLAASHGRGVILAPFTADEANPDWNGNLDLVDAESSNIRSQNISPDLLARYHDAYRRHFACWTDEARRHGVRVARVAAEPTLPAALMAEALPTGATELLAA